MPVIEHPTQIELTGNRWQYRGECVRITDVRDERVRIYADGWGRARWVGAAQVTAAPSIVLSHAQVIEHNGKREAHFAMLRTPDDCACLWCEAKRESGEFPPAGSPQALRTLRGDYERIP